MNELKKILEIQIQEFLNDVLREEDFLTFKENMIENVMNCLDNTNNRTKYELNKQYENTNKCKIKVALATFFINNKY